MSVPYWLDEPYDPRPPLAGDIEVEACVIGAGVAGLSCARRLAAHDIEAMVLERDTVAGGASGRNGGFLIAGLAPFHNDAVELYGRDYARRVYARTLEAQQEMYELAVELGVGDAVRKVGSLRVSSSEDEAEHVRRHVEALREDGFPGELLEHDELPPALRRSGWNACLTEDDGSLHPARWIRALAADAERAGVRIREGSAVRAPVNAPREGPVEVAAGASAAPLSAPGGHATPAGTPVKSAVAVAGIVRARQVIVAADGALPALVPGYAGRVRARRLHMVATEPLAERIVDQLVYARWGYEYFQQRPDGRILAGGFGDLDGDASYTGSGQGDPRIWDRIERYLREDIGVQAQITHRWTGTVGYTEDRRPVVGRVAGRPNLWVAGGYSGTGNIPGFLAGQELADRIAGTAGDPLF
ncbi:MAG TPA: FAD-dependent oxidoreductase [Thermoleophilaceae bacterium]|nr:FAD-dependent oxidoreductase [Thermoleophilaceae bacterium]